MGTDCVPWLNVHIIGSYLVLNPMYLNSQISINLLVRDRLAAFVSPHRYADGTHRPYLTALKAYAAGDALMMICGAPYLLVYGLWQAASTSVDYDDVKVASGFGNIARAIIMLAFFVDQVAN